MALKNASLGRAEILMKISSMGVIVINQNLHMDKWVIRNGPESEK